jgi:hypothetical protein
MGSERNVRYETRDALPDFDFDSEIHPAKIRWRGSEVEVKARLVPRYFWTTASIDVYLDAQCILRTGGVMKLTGSSRAEFDQDGSRHSVELSWETAGSASCDPGRARATSHFQRCGR